MQETKVSPFESRGSNEYIVGLFPDDIIGKGVGLRTRLFNWLVNKNNLSQYKTFNFYSAESDYVPVPSSNIDIGRRFGGQSDFFKKGSKILDLGCGYGAAVRDFSQKGVDITGLDPKYLNKNPLDKSHGDYVAGRAENLPFKDDTFTGILAFESFPTHVHNFEKSEVIMSELTRVSKEKAVWRATMPKHFFYIDSEKNRIANTQKFEMIGLLLSRFGWDYYHSPEGLLIARLENKKLTKYTTSNH